MENKHGYCSKTIALPIINAPKAMVTTLYCTTKKTHETFIFIRLSEINQKTGSCVVFGLEQYFPGRWISCSRFEHPCGRASTIICAGISSIVQEKMWH